VAGERAGGLGRSLAWTDQAGVVGVPLPPDEAFRLFTPEGERAWMPGWAPTYPMPAQSAYDPPEPYAGLVFITDDGGDTVPRRWVVTRWDPDRRSVAYSYARPGRVAAMIEVRVDRDGQGSVARVRYRLSALTPSAQVEVRSFGSGFQHMLAGWGQLIRKHLGS
jgi:hypothetical protein